MSKPDGLAVAKLHPVYRQPLDAVYNVHDRTHATAPVTFANMHAGTSGHRLRMPAPECVGMPCSRWEVPRRCLLHHCV